MNSYEFIAFFLLLSYAVSSYFKVNNKPMWLELFPFIALILSLVAIFSDGFRWQVVPIYIVLTILITAHIINKFKKPKKSSSKKWNKILRITGITLSIFTLASSVLMNYMFPIFDLPTPSGNYSVGTTELYMVDSSRDETYTSEPSDKRELMVRVWYPSEKTNEASKTPYWRNNRLYSAEFTGLLSLPNFMFEHLGKVMTNSDWSTPVSKQQTSYPVLVFSHGFVLGYMEQNTALMETLASHGYIVFSISHPYNGLATVFPDRRTITFDTEELSSLNNMQTAEAKVIYNKIKKIEDWHKQLAAFDSFDELMGIKGKLAFENSLNIWSKDQRFVMDQIEKVQLGIENSVQNINAVNFKGRLNINKIGILGMSFGGSTALETCTYDSRCKAGINMDGFQISQTELPSLERPFMFMNAQFNQLYNAMYSKSKGDVYSVKITGTEHLNYTDLQIFSPIFKIMGVVGPIDGYRGLDITQAYVLAFFDRYLKEKATPLLDSNPTEFKRVEFKKRMKKQLSDTNMH